MTPRQKEYQRLATAKWREAHPEYAEVERQRRSARIAAESLEERATRREKEIAYYIANKEKIAKRAKERRLENYEEKRRKESEASKKYRERNLEKVRERERNHSRANYAKYKPTIKANNRRRRAREKGAANTESIHLLTLAQRDGWTCHICGKRVSVENWSMDHLIPLSRGGDHTYVNVSLAHRICNIRRNVDRGHAQLRLL